MTTFPLLAFTPADFQAHEQTLAQPPDVVAAPARAALKQQVLAVAVLDAFAGPVDALELSATHEGVRVEWITPRADASANTPQEGLACLHGLSEGGRGVNEALALFDRDREAQVALDGLRFTREGVDAELQAFLADSLPTWGVTTWEAFVVQAALSQARGRSHRALDDLARSSQELGLYDDP